MTKIWNGLKKNPITFKGKYYFRIFIQMKKKIFILYKRFKS